MRQALLTDKTEIKFNIKDFFGVVVLVGTIAGVYFTMKSQIAEARELPKPPRTKEEIEYRDEVINNAILQTQKDIGEIKESIKILEERVYLNK